MERKMQARKYVQMSDDCTLELEKVHKIACCDCGLVHVWEFKGIGKRTLIFRVRRDKRATGQMRKNNKYETRPQKFEIDFLVSLQKHYFDIDCKNWESVGNKMVNDRIAQLRAV